MPFRYLPSFIYFICSMEKPESFINHWSKIYITLQKNSKPSAHFVIYTCVFVSDLGKIPILHSSLSSKTWTSWLSKWKHLQLLIFFPNWFEKTAAICLPNNRKENVFYTHHFSFNFCSSLSQGEELYTLRAIYNHQERHVGICLQNWFTKPY